MDMIATKLFTTSWTKDPLRTCIICLDDAQSIQPIKLDVAIGELQLTKTCECLCDVHVACVKEWLNVSHKCPICRKLLTTRYNNLSFTQQILLNNEFHMLNGIPIRRRTTSNRIQMFLSNIAFFPIYLFVHTFVMYTIIYGILKGFSHIYL
jgi:hypothetical protein